MNDVEAADCLTAWQGGVLKIIEGHGKVTNLITEITFPCKVDPTWLVDYSPHIVYGKERISDVIDTIFPTSLHERFPKRSDMYENYLVRHSRAMRWRRNRSRWGTYFARLIAFGREDKVNQLERVIDKLTRWQNRNTTGLVFHLSCATLDAPRTRGGPCWHFAEILWHPGDVIDLVVVYRNHDFFNKALGNFIALGQLLRFIADASGKTSGKLICHSVQAYSEVSMGYLKKLAKIS
jgi:hypothetical protein